MPTKLDVLITPADFEALRNRDLTHATCVVFDVLRATSSMITALANGADAILPFSDIPEALQTRDCNKTNTLLAGERHGLRILANLTGGQDFDLGNSPREFTPDRVRGKTIVMTTTNGTRAIRACDRAERVLVAAFLNLSATASHLRTLAPAELVLVCGGTFEQAAYEDVLAAGALADSLWPSVDQESVSDSVLLARKLYHTEKEDLLAGISRSRNGRRLLANPDLRADVSYCARPDVFNLVASVSSGGLIRQIGSELI